MFFLVPPNFFVIVHREYRLFLGDIFMHIGLYICYFILLLGAYIFRCSIYGSLLKLIVYAIGVLILYYRFAKEEKNGFFLQIVLYGKRFSYFLSKIIYYFMAHFLVIVLMWSIINVACERGFFR